MEPNYELQTLECQLMEAIELAKLSQSTERTLSSEGRILKMKIEEAPKQAIRWDLL